MGVGGNGAAKVGKRLPPEELSGWSQQVLQQVHTTVYLDGDSLLSEDANPTVGIADSRRIVSVLVSPGGAGSVEQGRRWMEAR